jgi:hypothetical protein
MIDQIIKYETAVLAKEKGFDIRSEPYRYNPIHEELTVLEGVNAPTQSLLQKWLRDKFSINIGLTYYNLAKSGYRNSTYWEYRLHYAGVWGQGNTYEEALEVGLQEALKLINNEKISK